MMKMIITALLLLGTTTLLFVHPASAFGFVTRQQQHHHTFTTTSSTTQLFSTPAATKITLDGETIRGPITPLGNFVLVRSKDSLSATDGGILLPDQAKERPTEGVVVAAGPGKLHPHTGVRIHCPVKMGMSVLHGKFDGTTMIYNDENMNMIRDDDIMLYYQGVKMTRDNVVPCRDYVLVQDDDSANASANLRTDSGIVVAASVNKDLEVCEGTIFRVGEGRLCSTGKFSPSPVQEGDRVKFRDYAGNPVKIDGVGFHLVRMVDILCAVPTEEE